MGNANQEVIRKLRAARAEFLSKPPASVYERYLGLKSFFRSIQEPWTGLQSDQPEVLAFHEEMVTFAMDQLESYYASDPNAIVGIFEMMAMLPLKTAKISEALAKRCQNFRDDLQAYGRH
ncbi:MAG TPA: hypothetical protein VEB86_00805 [Chryseosolibacter sp.]|nr:hypothetical protein [Chryseosolibacter sp.]